jgi:hypothetical protein
MTPSPTIPELAPLLPGGAAFAAHDTGGTRVPLRAVGGDAMAKLARRTTTSERVVAYETTAASLRKAL